MTTHEQYLRTRNPCWKACFTKAEWDEYRASQQSTAIPYSSLREFLYEHPHFPRKSPPYDYVNIETLAGFIKVPLI
jgi:hypothetical protein